jgi:ribosomal protein S8
MSAGKAAVCGLSNGIADRAELSAFNLRLNPPRRASYHRLFDSRDASFTVRFTFLFACDPQLRLISKMPLPHDLCSALKNGFRARHRRIALPHTTQNLGILSILLREGFITSITRGTTRAPDPAAWLEASEPQKRIWADLKYRDDRPVLRDMQLISKPSKRIVMEPGEIQRLCSGRRAKFVKPLGMGEVAIVRTREKDHEWLEAREALKLNMGGEVVCRVS